MTPRQEWDLRGQLAEQGLSPSEINHHIQSEKQKSQSEPMPQPSPEKKAGDGFVKSLVKSAASPFLRLGATAQAFGTSKIFGGKGADTSDKNIPFFGPQKPITTAKDALGVGAELASFAVGGGGATQLAKQGLKQAVTRGAIQGAKAGGLSGALYGGGQAAQQDKSTGQIFTDTLKGGAAGALAGGVLGGAVPAVSKTLQKTSEAVSGSLPKLNPLSGEARIINQRATELLKLENSNARLRKLSENSSSKGIDVKKLLAESDLLHNSIDDTGTIRTQDAIANLNEFIRPQEGVVRQNLEKEGKRIPLGMVEAKLKTVVNDSGLKGGAKLRALKNVEDDIAGYALEVDKDGYIPLAVIHDAKVDKYANINYLNPESKRADKAIARGLKELIEDHSKIGADKLNKELAPYFALQKYLEVLDGRKVEGGKLGKYFAQTLGGIAGSHFGPLGTVIGAEAAGRIRGAMMKSKFSSKLGRELQQSPTMQKAVEAGKDKVINL